MFIILEIKTENFMIYQFIENNNRKLITHYYGFLMKNNQFFQKISEKSGIAVHFCQSFYSLVF